jgi:hypothetical protein
MSSHAGPANWWTIGTNEGRTHIATKGVVQSGLVLNLDAGVNASYPGTGTTIYNLVGNNNHILRNAATYVTLNGVPCFDCTASSSYISPVTTNQILPTTGYTYLAWARMKSSNAEWRTLWRTTPDDHPLLVQSGGTALGMYDNNETGFNNSGYNTTPLYDTWAMWTIVGSVAAGTTFYINNAQVGVAVAQSAAGNTHNSIGGAGSQSFGHIAIALLYDRVLTAAEVQRNFNATRERYNI